MCCIRKEGDTYETNHCDMSDLFAVCFDRAYDKRLRGNGFRC